MTPQEIKRNGREGLVITWSNGETTELSSKLLRANCPGADSRAERGDKSHNSPLTAKKSSLKVVEFDMGESLKLEEIWGVGNYAIGMKWGDGHDSGIFTYDYLYELSKK